MTLYEAIEIRQMPNAPAHLVREAVRVIQLGQAMSRAQREVDFATITRQQLQVSNSLLAYRLAVACGKLKDWGG